MSLRIDVPNTCYIASSTVTGTVTLTGTEDIGVGSISITFSGRCKSKIVISRRKHGGSYNGSGSYNGGGSYSRSTYRGRVNLFTHTQKLFKGPHTLHPKEHSWPFTFKFPARCEARTGDRFQPHPRFCDDVNQPLPSTYNLPESGWQERHSGYVSYQLQATLVKDGTKFFTPALTLTTKTLRFINPRAEAEPDLRMGVLKKQVVCRSMHLLPGCEQRGLTFKEKLASMRSKNVPTAGFKLVLEMPKVVVCQQALPLYLGVEHELEKCSPSTPPTVFLKSAEVFLQANGSVQCINKEISWVEQSVISALHLKDRPIPISELIDLRHHMNLKTCWRSGPYNAFSVLEPSFATFNLELHYWLRVKVTVECARKKFKHEFVSRQLELLAEDWIGNFRQQPSPEQVAAAAADPQHTLEYNEAGPSEPLPPYAKNPELWTPSAGKPPPTT